MDGLIGCRLILASWFGDSESQPGGIVLVDSHRWSGMVFKVVVRSVVIEVMVNYKEEDSLENIERELWEIAYE